MNKRIYLTIDIECHDIDRRNQYIDGVYKNGNCGLKHILDLSKEYNVPVNCFLDIPEANVYGDKYIEEIINLIHSYGQNVYLHLHPDYISNDHNRTFLWQYSFEEKERILQSGFEQYEKLIGHKVEYFRVGRYGADKEMYQILNKMNYSICDLSYCASCPKMCHVDSNELNTYNGTTQYMNQMLLPNTRYLGLKFGKRRVFINFDASDTTYNEFKRILNCTNLKQLVLTMHSWNFIKKFYFLRNYVDLDRYEERKFIKMITYARKMGYEFVDLSSAPPQLDTVTNDKEINLCQGIFAKIQMIGNNFIRFYRIGRLNKKYFSVYLMFFIILLFVVLFLLFIFAFKFS